MSVSHQKSVEAPNPGVPLDLDWVHTVEFDPSTVDQSVQSLTSETDATKPSLADLLRAVSALDLTTLADDDTEERVRNLCARARQPLPPDLSERLGRIANDLRAAAVCVSDRFVKTALHELQGTNIKVATVSADFPSGLAPLEERIAQVHRSVEAGAHEIDVVIKRGHVHNREWQGLYDEIAAFKAACTPKIMKVILATGELQALEHIARASLVSMMAGADFIKTSTGKESVNATIPAGIVMTRAIRDYHRRTGIAVGFKPAGGIRTAKQVLEFVGLVRRELGERWLRSDLFRIGASSVLHDIERMLRSLSS